MKPTAQTTFWERAGRTLGRLGHGYARLDRRAVNWLVAQGWARGVAKAVLLVAKLTVVGVLLYVAFWLTLLLLFAVAAAWAARSVDQSDDESQPEWREGHSGFGLYDKNEWRHDIGDSD
ncbi:DUF3742 family protein [Ralstonia pseudosolanacearum]|uniref:DUF3742 family protein n=1 Tax=Ralstonia pseudosolanacearum TaxID=1310165 RepID=UPI0040543C18